MEPNLPLPGMDLGEGNRWEVNVRETDGTSTCCESRAADGLQKKMARSKEITRAEEKIDWHLVLGARATGENLASVAAWIGQRK